MRIILSMFKSGKLIALFPIIFLLLSASIYSQSQQQFLDSVQNLIDHSKGVTRANEMAVLIRRYADMQNYDKAVSLIDQLRAESIKSNNKKGIGDAYHLTGLIYQFQSNGKKALENYLKGLTFRKEAKDSLGISNTYNNIGNIYMERGNYQEALKYHVLALEIREKIKNEKYISMSYNNIGEVYRFQGNFSKALDFYFKDLRYSQKINNKYSLAISLNNVGTIYYELKNYKTALEYQEKAVKLNLEIGNYHLIADDYNAIGNIYQQLKKYDAAEEYYLKAINASKKGKDMRVSGMCYNNLGNLFKDKKEYRKAIDNYMLSLELLEGNNNRYESSETLKNMGEVYLLQNNYAFALKYLSQALEKAQQIGAKSIMQICYEKLAKAYELKKDYVHSYDAFVKYTALKDSLLGQKNINHINELSAEYESEKKEKEIELLKKSESLQKLNIANQQSEIAKQRLLVYFSIAAFVLIAISLLLLFNRYQIRKKSNEQLSLAFQQINEKNKLITSSINYSKRLQDAIFIKESEIKKYLPHSFVFFQPKDVVSGDFYWFSNIQNKNIVVVADCTGHGVPGALMSMIGNSLLNQIINAKKITDPAAILANLNNDLIKTFSKYEDTDANENGDGMDISVCTFDLNRKEVVYAGANHTLYLVKNGSVELVPGDNNSIGGIFGTQNAVFTNKKIDINTQTSVYLTSDGFTDQFGGEHNQKFMGKRFEALLKEIEILDVNQQKEKVQQTFNSWKDNNKQIDDVLLWGIKIA